MELGRRNFLRASFAFGAVGPALAQGTSAPNLRVGILSDIHVTALGNADWFEKALRHFDACKVDAVLITGDLTTWNKLPEFEAVATTWFKVFPNDRRSDGAPVVRLFLTGNHDVEGFAAAGAKFKTREEAEPASFFFHRDEFWRRLFHEGYEPIRARTVKGYTFILRNWHSRIGHPRLKAGDKYPLAVGMPVEENPAPEFLAKVAPTLPNDRPFFYAQHEPLSGTVNLSSSRPLDETAKVLAAFPNCLALSGHSHYSLTDERSIWQGAFTAVNCSCARGYAFTPPGRENGHATSDANRDPPFEMDKIDIKRVKQGMVMEVFDDRITFHRREFVCDHSLGPDWTVPLFGGRTVPSAGTPTYDFAARAATARPPAFAPDDAVAVTEIENGHRRNKAGTALDPKPRRQVIVSFPPVVTGTSHGRGFEFAVTAEMRVADMTQVVQEKRVFSPNAYMAEAEDTEPVTCAFARDDLPKRRDVRFVVHPIDCWGNRGKSIASDWRRLA